jgi:hypothetical protein
MARGCRMRVDGFPPPGRAFRDRGIAQNFVDSVVESRCRCVFGERLQF